MTIVTPPSLRREQAQHIDRSTNLTHGRWLTPIECSSQGPA
jgi:hypothetical protein